MKGGDREKSDSGSDRSPSGRLTERDGDTLRRIVESSQESLDRKCAELGSFLDNLPDIAWLKDCDSRYLSVNKAFCELVGMGRDELTGQTAEVCFGAEAAERFRRDDLRVMEGRVRKVLEETVEQEGNGKVWLETIKSPIYDASGEVTGTVGISRDITDRKDLEVSLRDHRARLDKLVEERTAELLASNRLLREESRKRERIAGALRLSEERYSLATGAAKVGVWDWNIETNEFYLDSNVKAILGYTDEEIPNDIGLWIEHVHPDDRDAAMAAAEAHLEGKTPFYSFEHRMVHKDGSTRWILAGGRAIRNDAGKAIRMVGTDADITERKRAEKTMASLARFPDENPDPVLRIAPDGLVLYANKASAPLLGYWGSSIEKPVPAPWDEKFREIYDSGEKQIVDVMIDGRTFSLSVVPLPDSEYLNVYGRDVTESVRMMRELARAEKLESIGVLAGGIAHDFNNYLTAILGNVSLLKLDSDPGTEKYDWLTQVEQATDNARALTQQLLTFSRGGAPVKDVVSLGELVDRTTNFTLRGSKVTYEIESDEPLFQVEVDKGQICQVISNLILNAEQSMPGGGTIRIACRNMVVGQGDDLALAPGPGVLLEVEDRGNGIAPNHLNRIFDPFFTTKDRGRGLGLATAYSIVKNHGGQIEVASERGAGTTFSISLPALESLAAPGGDEPETIDVGEGRVLVADDDILVRNLLRTTLSRFGYEVSVTDDGAKAVDAYRKAREQGAPFDVVILDLTIPGGMGGCEAIGQLRRIDGGVKAIVVSGYSNSPVMSRFRDYGFRARIPKPFKFIDLATTIRNVLESD